MTALFSSPPKPDNSIAKESLALQQKQTADAQAKSDKLDAQAASAQRAVRGRSGGRASLLFGDELGIPGGAKVSATLG